MKLLRSINAAPLALLVLATSMGCAEPAGEAVGSTHAESTKIAPTTLPKAARDATATLKQALAKDSVFAGRLGVEIATLRTVLSDDEVIAYQQ